MASSASTSWRSARLVAGTIWFPPTSWATEFHVRRHDAAAAPPRSSCMTEHRRPSSPPDRRLPDYQPVEPPGGGGQYRAHSGLAEAEKAEGGGATRNGAGVRAGVPPARHSRDGGGRPKLEVAARPSTTDTYGPATTYGPGAAPAPMPEPPKRRNRATVASARRAGVL